MLDYKLQPTYKFLLYTITDTRNGPFIWEVDELLKSDSIFNEVFQEALESDGLTLKELQQLKEWTIICLSEHRSKQ